MSGETETAERCAFHPDREAWIHCTRCSRPICGECVIPASVGQHCPACVKDAGRRIRSIKTGRAAPATLTIMAITILTYMVDLATGRRLTEELMVQSYLVLVGNEWWRLITPILVHGPIYHILFNMYALYAIGRILEEGQGTIRFLIVYLVSAVSASAMSLAVPVFLNPAGVLPVRSGTALLIPGGSIGASGGVFGLFGALAVLLWKRRHQEAARSALVQIVILIVINLIIGFSIGGIDNSAHIGGMIGGALIALGYDLGATRARWAQYWWAGVPLVIGLSAALILVARARLLVFI